MIKRALRFVRLPMLMILIFAIGRFWLGASGVEYNPRTNAATSTFMLTIATCFYWGALSKRVGKFGWKGTALVGITIGLWNAILILALTILSYLVGVEGTSFYTNWDNLNVPEGTAVPMGQAVVSRLPGLVAWSIFGLVSASIGRLLSFLAPAGPRPADRPLGRDADDLVE